jgi:hypothetical protein
MPETKPRIEIKPEDRGAGASPPERLLEAGILMPGQFADMVRRRHVVEGESKLLLAVLEDAIRLYLRNVDATGGERRREFVEVSGWFAAAVGPKAQSPSVFSFESLCAALDIDAARLRDRLSELTLDDLPSRRYQMRRHRPLSSLRVVAGRRHLGRARSDGS